MAHNYSISEFGLKLIKDYEGFRPVETALISGQRVIGYGHEYVLGEISVLTKKNAADLLKIDLEPFEVMVNHNIFAPLSQSQFDALVSLSFNIGSEAFLNSTIVHNLNNGQPLAAASGFDEWRKSFIVDQAYVVDALVRRRTAEKALFLSLATGVVAAPRKEVPPLHDSTARSGADDIEVFDTFGTRGYVDQMPSAPVPGRREDDPRGTLTLSKRAQEPSIYEDTLDKTPIVDTVIEDIIQVETKTKNAEKLSPIALAAVEVNERLDNLMENSADLLDTSERNTKIDEPGLKLVDNDVISKDIVITDELEVTAPEEEIKLERQAPKFTKDNKGQDGEVSGIVAYCTSLVVGLTLLGGGLWKLKISPTTKLDEMSAFLAPVAMLVGAMMILAGLYYLRKAQLRIMSK